MRRLATPALLLLLLPAILLTGSIALVDVAPPKIYVDPCPDMKPGEACRKGNGTRGTCQKTTCRGWPDGKKTPCLKCRTPPKTKKAAPKKEPARKRLSRRR